MWFLYWICVLQSSRVMTPTLTADCLYNSTSPFRWALLRNEAFKAAHAPALAPAPPPHSTPLNSNTENAPSTVKGTRTSTYGRLRAQHRRGHRVRSDQIETASGSQAWTSPRSRDLEVTAALAKIPSAKPQSGADPNDDDTDNEELAFDLYNPRRMTEFLDRLRPDASGYLRLAVRAKHFRR